ncbi:hypothetical protein D3C78_1142900 [compost metagenome]
MHPGPWFVDYVIQKLASQDSSFVPQEFLIHNTRTVVEYKIHSGEQTSICCGYHIFARRTYELLNPYSPALCGLCPERQKTGGFPAGAARSCASLKLSTARQRSGSQPVERREICAKDWLQRVSGTETGDQRSAGQQPKSAIHAAAQSDSR